MFNLLPKNPKFFDDLDALAGSLTASSKQLGAIFQRFPNFDGELNQIESERGKARDLYRSSLQRLDRAFITPLDREDILSLITEIYGVIDLIADLSQRLRLYRLEQLYPDLTNQAKNLEALSVQLQGIVRELRHEVKLDRIQSGFDSIGDIMEQVKKDREQFLESLFSTDAKPLEVMKRKELHDLLDEAIERAESTSETLARTVLKNG